MTPPLNFLRHGSAGPLPERRPLRAGPFSLVFEAGDLRYVKFGGREVIRRIYGAVRDQNWDTVPAEISDLKIEDESDSFRIRYTSTHRRGDIHFVWQAELTGAPDGGIRFAFDGEAKSTFQRSRIGLCVLHPIRECAGVRCRALHRDGTRSQPVFPDVVASRQPVPGFQNLAGLAHEIEPGLWAELLFDGEAFETEDQRNWIDASFKTYGTPLEIPRPVTVPAGTRVRQAVTLQLRSDGAPVHSFQSTPLPTVLLQAGGTVRCRLPELGLGMASHGRPLSQRELARLSRLGLSHLRADLRLTDPRWPEALRAAAREALELGAALELAVHLPPDEPGELASVAKELIRLKADPIRALILRDGQKSTTAADLQSARTALADSGLAIGAGTDADLYQLHLQAPAGGADFLSWSMNPQVHARDLTSIAETPEVVAQQVAAARQHFGDVPLAVSPITLRPRFNPGAGGPESASPPDELPPQVDPRQSSLFGAAWTLAMLAALAPTGLESLTLFETTGWRGVMETESGGPLPAKFPSIPGAVFPLYHVLADVGEFAGGEVLGVHAAPAHALAFMGLRKADRTAFWLANLTEEPRRVRIAGLPGAVRWRRLDETSVLAAMTEPETFRRDAGPSAGSTHEEFTLPALAVLRLLSSPGPHGSGHGR